MPHLPFSRGVVLVVTLAACRDAAQPARVPTSWWIHVERLAADDMSGRMTGTEGHAKAAEYVREHFESAGLRPVGPEGFLQTVPFDRVNLVEDRSSLELVRGPSPTTLAFGIDVIAAPVGTPGTLDAEMVFAGYGLSVPEYSHDDFRGLDVDGKVVLLLTGAPANIPSIVAAHHSSFEQLSRNLEKRGAAGMVVVMNPRLEEIPWDRLAATRSQFTQSFELADPALKVGAGMRVLAIANPARASVFFDGAPATLAEILERDAKRMPLAGFPLEGRLRSSMSIDRSPATSHNVVGILPGSDPRLAKEYVLVSAHLDHMGVGDAVNGDAIYNGAMDNASGVATLLVTARMLRDGGIPGRSVVFLACTGEEQGLLGSKYFANRGVIPMRDVAANVNLDMFLPIVPLRTVRGYGAGESSLASDLAAVAMELNVVVQDDPEPELNVFIRSDQYSFTQKGVPALFLSVGFDAGTPEAKTMTEWFATRYHAPSDDVQQPIDRLAADRFNELMVRLITRVANAQQRPTWNSDSFFRRFAEAN